MKARCYLKFLFLIIMCIIALPSSTNAQDDSDAASAGQSYVEDSPDTKDTLDDTEPDQSADENNVSEVDPEHYRKRVRYEVIASAVILLTFFFFVALISMVRFKRSVKALAKIDRDKKFEYKDIWGKPRVHQDDLPTDKEMQGIDTLDDDDSDKEY